MNTLKYKLQSSVSVWQGVEVMAAAMRALSRQVVTVLVELGECFEGQESLSFDERLQRTGRVRYR